MIYLPNFYQSGVQYLLTWRNRYTPSEYPYKVVLNIFYRKYHMEAMWSDVIDCFKVDKSGDPIVKWKDYEEGFQILLNIYSSKTPLVNPVLESKLKNYPSKELGGTTFENFRDNIINAQRGSKKDIESIEYAYLYYKLTDEMILLFAAMCGSGMKPIGAMNLICQLPSQVDFTNYSQCSNALGSGCVAPWMKNIYKPL